MNRLTFIDADRKGPAINKEGLGRWLKAIG